MASLPSVSRGLLAALCCTGAALCAAPYRVDSLAALQDKINHAQPGDVITLRNGTYPTTASLKVACAGTTAQPVEICAETVGGVTLTGPQGFTVAAPAAHVVIRGFQFAHASGRIAIAGGTNAVRFTRNTFRCTGEGPYLTVTGDNAEVDHNEFRDKATLGNMINVTGTGSQVARKLWIHHNYFHDFANAHGNGAETIRFGLSGLSMSTGQGLVEHNLFVRCTGENELISNKSCGNTYRYNTFLDSPGAQFTLRHGNDCLVYGNIFKGTDGLRIFGDRQQVFSNYLEGNTLGLNIGNGDGEVADGAKLTSHDRPDYCVISFNTLVDNRVQYQMNGRKDGMGATHTTFANNIIQGGEAAAKIDGPYPGAVWQGNLLWHAGGAGGLPATGFTTVDPQLRRGTDGLLRPAPGSPAIDAAVGDFPAVSVDLDGQPRVGKKDQGADEASSAPVIARLLTPADVGPAAP
jgi:poly(beta-D-mannuronate) lyase